jgi:hypothetical protein
MAVATTPGALAKEKGGDKDAGEALFTGAVPKLRVEVPPEGVEVLRRYHQVWRQERPERVDVRATVHAGGQVYEDVAVHLKGSYSYQPFDARPSLTLNFDKFVPGRRFYGLSKIHLNNGVQDGTGICEQFGREMFKEVGIAAPRATPALLTLNGRDMGVYVLVEGANKSFVVRNFGKAAVRGNMYDGGSGGDVTKELDVVSGEKPDDHSALKALVEATREADPAKRLARLERVLDVEQFVTFAAVEALMVHWDGYAIGCNNYRALHDAARDKFVFVPHGMDQLFGTSSTPTLSITPVFRGAVAKALFTVPEGRERYLRRIEALSKKEFAVEALHGRVDRLAKRLRAALPVIQQVELEFGVEMLKSRITQRAQSVAEQLKAPKRPMEFVEGAGAMPLKAGWRFKRDSQYQARGVQTIVDGRVVMRVIGGGGATGSGGSWRTSLLLGEGHYEFTGLARTSGLGEANDAPAGVMFRVSGETETAGIAVSEEWKPLTYAFDVRGVEEVELVCEFRGPNGSGEFDAASLKLARKGPAKKAAAAK